MRRFLLVMIVLLGIGPLVMSRFTGAVGTSAATRPGWTMIPVPTGVSGYLDAVTCLSATDCFAGGVAKTISAPPPSSSTYNLVSPSSRSNQGYTTSRVVHADGTYWFAVAQYDGLNNIPRPMNIYRWAGTGWRSVYAKPDAFYGGLDPGSPITVANLTGSEDPDFLLRSTGADTAWLSVFSDRSGRWAPVPFDDAEGTTTAENAPTVSSDTVTVAYNSCEPDCAQAKESYALFHYSRGSFVPDYPPRACEGELLAKAVQRDTATDTSFLGAITGFACDDGYAIAGVVEGEDYGSLTLE
jgi:hypothetical protein